MPAVEGNESSAKGTNATAVQKLKPSVRAVGQVMAALKNSKNTAGPTMTEIVKFVSASLLKPATKRQICTALKRGVEFGILKRKRGHYLLSSPEENYSKLPVTVLKSPKKTTRSNTIHHHMKPLDRVAKRKRDIFKSKRNVRRVIEQVPRFTIPEKPYISSVELEEMYRNRQSAFSSATSLVDGENHDMALEYFS